MREAPTAKATSMATPVYKDKRIKERAAIDNGVILGLRRPPGDPGLITILTRSY